MQGTESPALREPGVLSHSHWSVELNHSWDPNPSNSTHDVIHVISAQREGRTLFLGNRICWNGSDELGPKTEPYVIWRIYFQSHCSIMALND